MSDRDLLPGTGPGFVEDCLRAFLSAASETGIAVTAGDLAVVRTWLAFYSRWQGRRVVGFTEPRDVATKLLVDSYAARLLDGALPQGPVIDMGSGNGWPGLTFAEREEVVLLDSRKGACDFMRGFVRDSGMSNVHVAEARAEEAGSAGVFAGRFALVATRAMASPAVAVEVAAPFLRKGGSVVLWLGPQQESSVTSHGFLPEVGLSLAGIRRYELPYSLGKRVLVLYKKTRATLPGFPRKMATIKAKPLFG